MWFPFFTVPSGHPVLGRSDVGVLEGSHGQSAFGCRRLQQLPCRWLTAGVRYEAHLISVRGAFDSYTDELFVISEVGVDV